MYFWSSSFQGTRGNQSNRPHFNLPLLLNR